ncbi:MAG: hypothetical protein P8163_03700 [Candidatus Thiodiazotropha sp.]
MNAITADDMPSVSIAEIISRSQWLPFFQRELVRRCNTAMRRHKYVIHPLLLPVEGVAKVFGDTSLSLKMRARCLELTPNSSPQRGLLEGPFSFREKHRMRGVETLKRKLFNTFPVLLDPLTPTLSLWEKGLLCFDSHVHGIWSVQKARQFMNNEADRAKKWDSSNFFYKSPTNPRIKQSTDFFRLNRLMSKKRKFQVYPTASFLP